MGYQGSVFDSPLSLTGRSRFFDNLSTNNSTKIRQILKSLLGMSIETRIIRLVKKNGSQIITLDCPFKVQRYISYVVRNVPLSCFFFFFLTFIFRCLLFRA